MLLYEISRILSPLPLIALYASCVQVSPRDTPLIGRQRELQAWSLMAPHRPNFRTRKGRLQRRSTSQTTFPKPATALPLLRRGPPLVLQRDPLLGVLRRHRLDLHTLQRHLPLPHGDRYRPLLPRDRRRLALRQLDQRQHPRPRVPERQAQDGAQVPGGPRVQDARRGRDERRELPDRVCAVQDDARLLCSLRRLCRRLRLDFAG